MKQLWYKAGIYFKRLLEKINEERARQWVERSKDYLAKGRVDEALTCLKRSLSLEQNFMSAYNLMAKIMMPGDDYISILSRLHQYINPKSYVEIGVFEGESLALTQHSTLSIGIDPFPHIRKEIKSYAKIYPITSDEFFKTYNLFEELKTRKLSLAFIDGLHHSEQLLMDFINLERYSDNDTVIILHDCLPINRLIAGRTRSTAFWAGDTWKVVPFLIKYSPDLNINVIPTAPSGLGIITNLDPNSTLLLEKYSQFISEHQNQDLPYDHLNSSEGLLFRSSLNIVPNEWEQILQLLQ
jgi:tetratricopeptide (TPR) repeat protein